MFKNKKNKFKKRINNFENIFIQSYLKRKYKLLIK